MRTFLISILLAVSTTSLGQTRYSLSGLIGPTTNFTDNSDANRGAPFGFYCAVQSNMTFKFVSFLDAGTGLYYERYAYESGVYGVPNVLYDNLRTYLSLPAFLQLNARSKKAATPYLRAGVKLSYLLNASYNGGINNKSDFHNLVYSAIVEPGISFRVSKNLSLDLALNIHLSVSDVQKSGSLIVPPKVGDMNVYALKFGIGWNR